MKILLAPHPMLTTVCRPFDFAAPEKDPHWMQREMTTVMMGERGIGLAAPQVGIDLRMFLFVMDGQVRACFNPAIEALAGRLFEDEGCLSFPRQFLKVSRAANITAVWTDANGNACRFNLHGLESRCFQHELDHLDGKTFDKAAPPLAAALRMKQMADRAKRRR